MFGADMAGSGRALGVIFTYIVRAVGIERLMIALPGGSTAIAELREITRYITVPLKTPPTRRIV